MSPTRLEWLLRLSLKQMDTAYHEGVRANDRGQHPGACPYKEFTARRFAWLKGWNRAERDSGPAFD